VIGKIDEYNVKCAAVVVRGDIIQDIDLLAVTSEIFFIVNGAVVATMTRSDIFKDILDGKAIVLV